MIAFAHYRCCCYYCFLTQSLRDNSAVGRRAHLRRRHITTKEVCDRGSVDRAPLRRPKTPIQGEHLSGRQAGATKGLQGVVGWESDGNTDGDKRCARRRSRDFGPGCRHSTSLFPLVYLLFYLA